MFYRNTLHHLFLIKAFVSLSFCLFGAALPAALHPPPPRVATLKVSKSSAPFSAAVVSVWCLWMFVLGLMTF